MANTGTTTRINLRFLALGILGTALAFFSLANLFSTLTPVEQLNRRIADALGAVDRLSPAGRPQLISQLRQQQEWALAREPAEPFAWARLAYLRMAAENDPKSAFAALQMSDIISPGEPRQLPERAVMWWQLRAAQTPEQKAYQDTLWQKAFELDRDATWEIAKKNRLIAEAGQSLKRTAPDLYEEWKERVREQ